MNVEEYINQQKPFSFALKKWGIEGILSSYKVKINRFLYKNRFDLDDYCGDFLMSRLAIEDFKKSNLFSDSQLKVIEKLDSEFLLNTVETRANIYTLSALKKNEYNKETYWFLFRIPEEAIYRLQLRSYIF